jgi:PKD repeat protein
VAAFVGTPRSGTTPLAVAFTDQSTNNPASWSWTFGDGTNSTSQNPSHTYATAGSYTVTLTATNAAGSDGETKIRYITVTTQPSPPVAAFVGTPRSGTAPLAVAFTDQSTNNPTHWSWTFGDGTNSSSQNPSHSYTKSGAYTVTLTATNAAGSDGETKTRYITVTAPPAPPGAGFEGTPLSGPAPLTVAFSDQSTNDPTSWSWAFGDGGSSSAQNPSHVYSAPGTYRVTLTATNSVGSNLLSRSAYIQVFDIQRLVGDQGTLAIQQTRPNPARSLLEVDLTIPQTGPTVLTLFDTSGRRVGLRQPRHHVQTGKLRNRSLLPAALMPGACSDETNTRSEVDWSDLSVNRDLSEAVPFLVRGIASSSEPHHYDPSGGSAC